MKYKYLIPISILACVVIYAYASESPTKLQVCQTAFMEASNQIYRYNETHSRYKVAMPKYDCNEEISSTTGSVIPVPSGYTTKHTLVLTGSHDYRIYSNRLGASWKNNNSAGLTWGVSNTLKSLWSDAGIRYKKGSLRPANEKGNYIHFETVEEGIRAKIIAIRERWGNATVGHYLSGWGTDHVDLSFSKSKIIKELTDGEFTELFVQQMKKESPGYTSQLIKDKILIVN